MKKLVLLIIVAPLIYLTSACEEVEPKTTGIDPFFRIRFINADSLSIVNALIDNIDARIEFIDDSLVYYDTLDNGTDVTAILERLNNEKTSISIDKTDLNSTKTLIENGSVVVNSITSPFGVEAILPGIERATLFSIPLDPSENISNYQISLAGMLYDLEARYRTNTLVEQRTVIVQALDLSVTSSSFDVQFIEYQDSLSNNSTDAIVTVHF